MILRFNPSVRHMTINARENEARIRQHCAEQESQLQYENQGVRSIEHANHQLENKLEQEYKRFSLSFAFFFVN